MSAQPNDFAIRKDVDRPFEEALGAVRDALKREGFGVLTEIDMRATLAEKLGVEFRNYRILGACNPPFAHRALSADLAVGLVMPCNVVVYEREPGKAAILAIDPTTTVAASGNAALVPLAAEVKDRLTRALDSL